VLPAIIALIRNKAIAVRAKEITPPLGWPEQADYKKASEVLEKVDHLILIGEVCMKEQCGRNHEEQKE
jgi:hypothetical protein